MDPMVLVDKEELVDILARYKQFVELGDEDMTPEFFGSVEYGRLWSKMMRNQLERIKAVRDV